MELELGLKDIMILDTGDPTFLVDGIIPDGALCLLTGQPKFGKTMLALDMALAVATGQNVLGLGTRQGTVLWIDNEMTLKRDLIPRLRKLSIGRGITDYDLPFYLAPNPVRDEEDCATLRAMCERRHPNIIVIDPLISYISYDGDENDPRYMRRLSDRLKALARDYNTAVLVLHHPCKQNSQYKASPVRGSGDIDASADAALEITRSRSGIRLTQRYIRCAQEIEPIGYALISDDDSLRLERNGVVSKPSSRLAKAQEAILSILCTHPDGIPTREVKDALKAAGHKDRTISDAYKALVDEGICDGSTHGLWKLAPPQIKAA